MSLLIERPFLDDSWGHAVGFIEGVRARVIDWKDKNHYSHEEWPADGFVYFAVIGYPYISHVKVGFTAGDPEKRIKNLQTGCPYPIKLLGYIFGSVEREQELHSVFDQYRGLGEWFEYSEYVASVIEDQLTSAPVV